jgi:hypothetical protein
MQSATPPVAPQLKPGDVVRAYAGTKSNRPCVVIRQDKDSHDVWVAIAGQGQQHQVGDPCSNPAFHAQMGLDKVTYFEKEICKIRVSYSDKCGECPPAFFLALKKHVGIR